MRVRATRKITTIKFNAITAGRNWIFAIQPSQKWTVPVKSRNRRVMPIQNRSAKAMRIFLNIASGVYGAKIYLTSETAVP